VCIYSQWTHALQLLTVHLAYSLSTLHGSVSLAPHKYRCWFFSVRGYAGASQVGNRPRMEKSQLLHVRVFDYIRVFFYICACLCTLPNTRVSPGIMFARRFDVDFVMTVCHFGTKYLEILSLLPPPMSLVPLSSDQPPLPPHQITVLAQGLYLSYITDHSTRTGSLPLHCAIFQARQATRPPSSHVESLSILV